MTSEHINRALRAVLNHLVLLYTRFSTVPDDDPEVEVLRLFLSQSIVNILRCLEENLDVAMLKYTVRVVRRCYSFAAKHKLLMEKGTAKFTEDWLEPVIKELEKS